MSKQVLKRQLEAFTASNIDNELYTNESSHLNEQGKKLKRKKRQLTLAEQIKKENERHSKQNHTADNMRYLLFGSSRVASAVKKTTKPKTEDEKYIQYGDEKLARYLGSLKRLKGVDPAEKRRAMEERMEREKKASVDSLYDSVVAGDLDGDDLGNGTGLKGRSKDGYQYGKSTKRLKNSF